MKCMLSVDGALNAVWEDLPRGKILEKFPYSSPLVYNGLLKWSQSTQCFLKCFLHIGLHNIPLVARILALTACSHHHYGHPAISQ